MSPIENLRKGIFAGDWTKVCAAYQGLTGESLSPPSEKTGVDVDGRALFAKFASALEAGIRRQIKESMDDFFGADNQDAEALESPGPSLKKQTSAKKSGGKTAKSPVKKTAPSQPTAKKKTPTKPGQFVNNFVDDHKGRAKLIKETKDQVEKSAGETKERRPPMDYVDVRCGNCGKKERLPSHIARLNADSTGYHCNNCVPRRSRQ